MPDSNIIQIDQNLLETRLDRLITEKMTQILNAMLDAEADEITGARQIRTQGGAQGVQGRPLRTHAHGKRRAGSRSGCRNSRARSSNPRSSNATAGGSPASRRR